MHWPILIRRVEGISMLPTLSPGQVVVALRPLSKPKVGDVVIIRHNGTEKIKRITAIDQHGVHVQGDNVAHSTDSRHFGPVPPEAVVARVVELF